jgi:hypothetical protein
MAGWKITIHWFIAADLSVENTRREVIELKWLSILGRISEASP